MCSQRGSDLDGKCNYYLDKLAFYENSLRNSLVISLLASPRFVTVAFCLT